MSVIASLIATYKRYALVDLRLPLKVSSFVLFSSKQNTDWFSADLTFTNPDFPKN